MNINKKVEKFVRDYGVSVPPVYVAQEFDLTWSEARTILDYLCEDGILVRMQCGRYFAEPQPQAPEEKKP